ncbi:MAG: DUF2330 domain-containing protein [Capsulimonas sp.]|uniref:DUF2330 domain-containing protein n=1 Tax=Capsulimonas sp. TaxID=2494211 RepID=UPI00326327B3
MTVKHLPTLLAITGSLAASHSVHACATLSLPGTAMEIAQEQAIIVWDPATHTEHFIRRADFVGTGKDVGFLVPTPEAPKLNPVNDEVFGDLDKFGEPEINADPRQGIRFTSVLEYLGQTAGNKLGTVGGNVTAEVDVVSSETVGGYDATVLRANDAGALEQWLHSYGYSPRTALSKWLAPYVQKGWAITAFKITAGGHQGADPSASVCMTFHTEKPFFPYSEPSDSRIPNGSSIPRSLSIYLLTTSRMEGVLETGTNDWQGETLFTKRLSAGLAPELRKKLTLSEEDAAPGQWITAFVDRAPARIGDGDLDFQPSRSQDEIVPPTKFIGRDERTPIYVDVLAFFALIVFSIAGGWKKLGAAIARRRRQRQAL